MAVAPHNLICPERELAFLYKPLNKKPVKDTMLMIVSSVC